MYSDELIVIEVDRKIRKETKENMDVYCMGLGDAFKEACRKYAEKVRSYTKHGIIMIFVNIFLVLISENI